MNEELVFGKTEKTILDMLKRDGKIQKSQVFMIYHSPESAKNCIRKLHSLGVIRIDGELLFYAGEVTKND